MTFKAQLEQANDAEFRGRVALAFAHRAVQVQSLADATLATFLANLEGYRGGVTVGGLREVAERVLRTVHVDAERRRLALAVVAAGLLNPRDDAELQARVDLVFPTLADADDITGGA